MHCTILYISLYHRGACACVCACAHACARARVTENLWNIFQHKDNEESWYYTVFSTFVEVNLFNQELFSLSVNHFKWQLCLVPQSHHLLGYG